MHSAKHWFIAARPKTLFAAASPVLIGAGIAFGQGVWHPASAILALVSALMIQIGTNYYNDYADSKSGVDTPDRKGPKRGIHSGNLDGEAMKKAAVVAFVLAVLAGAFLMWRGGWPIVLVGIGSISLGFLYTAGKYSLASLGIADIFVFLFFGPIAVAGTYYVQALSWPFYIWLIGCAPGALSVAILLVNNIRDIDEDRAGGRNTIVVRFGRSFGIRAYMGCILVAMCIPPLVIYLYAAPVTTLASSVVLLGTLPGIHSLRTISAEESAELNPVLASTARILFFFSGLYAFAWILSA